MTIMRTGMITVALLSVSLLCGAAAAQLTPEVSLNNCQNAVKVETANYIKGKQTAIAACLQRISIEVVKKNGAGDVGLAAATCVAQFRKISDSRLLGKSLGEKFTAKVGAKCDPAQSGVTHTLGDILGAGAGVNEPLNAQNISAWCARFGGDGSIDTVQEWMSCIQTAAECSVDAAISTQYSRALEWLDEVRPDMEGLTPPSTDLTKVSDAVDGLDTVRAAIGGTGNLTPTIQCGWNGVAATGQTTASLPGDDGAIQAGLPSRGYNDNDDGTITDLNTGLMWEKKIQLDGTANAANPNDADNRYVWWGICTGDGVTNCGTDADCSVATGTCNAGAPSLPFVGQTIFQQVAALNAASFAGHNDWRVPNIKELESLMDFGQYLPALNAAFHGASCGASCTDLTDPSCSCDAGSDYWSSTSFVVSPNDAWSLFSGSGGMGHSGKTNNFFVRAVRGGL